MLTRLIDTWLAMRRAQGCAFRHDERDLHRFAEFAAARGEDHIRTATAVAWAGQAGTRGQRRRHLQRLVQLARSLHAEDDRPEIPPAGHFPGSRHRPVPYLYTRDEARRLITVAARLGPAGSLRPRTMSTVLALLVATGLRISAALALRTADVTPDGLVVRHTKGRTEGRPTDRQVAGVRSNRRKGASMIETVEATIEPDGTVRLHEPLRFPVARRALVVILEDGASTTETALLSEKALAADWNRAEEDAAWEHLQRAR